MNRHEQAWNREMARMIRAALQPSCAALRVTATRTGIAVSGMATRDEAKDVHRVCNRLVVLGLLQIESRLSWHMREKRARLFDGTPVYLRLDAS